MTKTIEKSCITFILAVGGGENIFKRSFITLLILLFVVVSSNPLLVLAEENESLNETEVEAQEKKDKADEESELNTKDPATGEESINSGEANPNNNSDSQNEENRSTNQEIDAKFESQESEGTNENEQEQYEKKLNSVGSESQDRNSNEQFLEGLEALGFENNEGSIEAFQRYYELEVTGEVNEATEEKIEEVLASPFQNGKRHEDSVELKEYLVVLGYLNFDNPTTYYGPQTEEAVKEFQTDEGLPVSGIIEPNTKETLEELATGPLSYGMYREDAIALKENLNKLGFTSFNGPNDYFGAKTEQGVEDLQSYYELDVTGVVNEATVKKIEEILSSPFQDGKSHEDSIELKEYLEILGFVTWDNDPTDYFGTRTEEAVKEFQETEGLPVSGIIDLNTRERLEELSIGPLSYGMYREDAVALKEDLNKLGFTSFNGPNDYFGAKTEQGVEDLQSYYDLEVTGVANEATFEKIEEILSSPFQDGESHEDSVELKENLETLGFVSWDNDPTDYFGSSTEEAVKEFQAAKGLPVSGIIEPNTKETLEELATGPLSYGMYREDVITLKENLNKLGFTSFNGPNDYFGAKTEQGVEDLQSYYDLEVTGVANEATLEKIEEILSSAFQDGESHGDSVELKENLETLGFVSWEDDPTNYFGLRTEQAVKDFQEYYGLPNSGIAEKNTRNKIQDILSSPFQSGKSNEGSVGLKENLETLGFVSWEDDPTDYFGPRTEQAVKDFQEYHGLPNSGIAEDDTRDKIQEVLSTPLQYGKSHEDSIELKKNLELLGIVSWDNDPTDYFGTRTEQAVKEFQEQYDLPVSGIADTNTLDKLKTEVQDNIVKIFLDPGHGGHDPGGQGYSLNEKDVVLDIALATENVLSQNYAGVEVKLSRTTDTFVELEDRAQMANNWGADYFVSIHNNAFTGAAHGFESYIYNGNVSSNTIEKQNQIHQYIANELSARNNISDRGKKTANFNVLRNTAMSAILLELLFIDNWSENTLLQSSSFRAELSKITADAIAHAFNLKRK
ncbi:peptidoglycan-binding protein [Lentibacillus salicampi]|uniref:MurNAc-LAA domain-containing protein n=1 Tax=Lentibacillus salicampi TaxID=175306 RepID=A0A4Y9AA72_9BACI|nr:peptidoglycan-binding protein [Lentibacillus salicampi]TFJ91254.1 hypothetical protein E4U82_18680 [Lentibacillus salicampi]